MSHPPETSRELVDALARLSPVNPGLKWLDDAKALIDAWVRVREIQQQREIYITLEEKLRREYDPRLPFVQIFYALIQEQLDNIESTLATARSKVALPKGPQW